MCLVGVIVAIDDINSKYTSLTIDDGSGATIELKIVRVPVAEKNPVDACSNTTIGNVNVVSRLGVFEVTVENQPVDIGTVVKAKGTISEFRDVKQLDLKRIWVITTTNDEAHAWQEAAIYKKNVLSKPWRLTSAEHKQIIDQIKANERESKKSGKVKRENEAKKEAQRKEWEAHIRKRDAKWEIRRRKEDVMMNSGALI